MTLAARIQPRSLPRSSRARGLAIAGAILVPAIIGVAMESAPDVPGHAAITASGCANAVSSYRVHLPCQGVPDSPAWISQMAGTTATGCFFGVLGGPAAPATIALGCAAGLASNIPWGSFSEYTG